MLIPVISRISANFSVGSAEMARSASAVAGDDKLK